MSKTNVIPPLRVVQCWDDGNVQDIRLCGLLRKYGAKASFNLSPGLHGAYRYEEWKYKDEFPVIKLSKAEWTGVYEGFTIANHTMTHARATQVSINQWRSEVEDGRKQLQDHFGQRISGFAYPFGDHCPEKAAIVGEIGHSYARTCNQRTPCFPPVTPLCFEPDCHHASSSFWMRYEKAEQVPNGVFYFWGHSYEFTTDAEWLKFEVKLARISSDPRACWVDLPDLFV